MGAFPRGITLSELARDEPAASRGAEYEARALRHIPRYADIPQEVVATMIRLKRQSMQEEIEFFGVLRPYDHVWQTWETEIVGRAWCQVQSPSRVVLMGVPGSVVTRLDHRVAPAPAGRWACVWQDEEGDWWLTLRPGPRYCYT